MTRQRIRSPRFLLTLIAAMLSLAGTAQAGPPLICHTIEIGEAKSLPWISHNWNLSGGETYDTKNLVRDTLEILAPDTPVLVRMESLRRDSMRTRTGVSGAWNRCAAPRFTPAKTPSRRKNSWRDSMPEQPPPN